jgi:hypothetical protein
MENQHWLEQVVYANCGGKVRIGIAGGLKETLLQVPFECLGRSTSFLTDPIGSEEVSMSDAVIVEAGDVWRVSIPAVFNGYLFLSK